MDSFLGNQHREGEFDSHGEFTLDLVATRRKLAAAQFEQRDYYILKLVQAGVQMRARRIVIRLVHPEVGVTYEEPEDASLLDLHLLRQGLLNPFKLPSGALRDIAWGLLSVVSEKAPAMEFNTHRQRLRFGPDGERVTQVSYRQPHLEIRVWCGIQNEAKLLQERCRFSPVPLVVNRTLVSGQRFGEALAERHLPGSGLYIRPPLAVFESVETGTVVRTEVKEKDAQVALFERSGAQTGDCRGVVVLRRPLEGQTAVYFTKHGVMDSFPTKLGRGLPGGHVVASGDAFETDLSGLRVLQTDEVRRHLAELEDEMMGFGARVAEFLNGRSMVLTSTKEEPNRFLVVFGLVGGTAFGVAAGAWGGVIISMLGAFAGGLGGFLMAQATAPQSTVESGSSLQNDRRILNRALGRS